MSIQKVIPEYKIEWALRKLKQIDTEFTAELINNGQAGLLIVAIDGLKEKVLKQEKLYNGQRRENNPESTNTRDGEFQRTASKTTNGNRSNKTVHKR